MNIIKDYQRRLGHFGFQMYFNDLNTKMRRKIFIFEKKIQEFSLLLTRLRLILSSLLTRPFKSQEKPTDAATDAKC